MRAWQRREIESPTECAAHRWQKGCNECFRPCAMAAIAPAMNGGTTIARQIERLIVRLDGAAVCDACVTDRLNLSVPSQANVVTRALGGQRGFERCKDACALCGSTRTVIRKAGRNAS